MAFVSFLFGTFCAPGLQLSEEVVTLIVNKDERREVFNCDFPYSLHAYFRKLYAFNALYAVLRKYRCNTADSAKVEAAVLLASVGNLFATISLAYHNH